MARTKSRGGARAPSVAIELLESDHRKVEGLFDRFARAKEGDEESKRAIAQRICGALKVHAKLEEELFYPWLRENMDEEEMEMHARKAELMEEHGLMADDGGEMAGERARSRRAQGQGQGAQRSR